MDDVLYLPGNSVVNISPPTDKNHVRAEQSDIANLARYVVFL